MRYEYWVRYFQCTDVGRVAKAKEHSTSNIELADLLQTQTQKILLNHVRGH